MNAHKIEWGVMDLDLVKNYPMPTFLPDVECCTYCKSFVFFDATRTHEAQLMESFCFWWNEKRFVKNSKMRFRLQFSKTSQTQSCEKQHFWFTSHVSMWRMEGDAMRTCYDTVYDLWQSEQYKQGKTTQESNPKRSSSELEIDNLANTQTTSKFAGHWVQYNHKERNTRHENETHSCYTRTNNTVVWPAIMEIMQRKVKTIIITPIERLIIRSWRVCWGRVPI